MTPGDIKALTPIERLQLLERLATAHYGEHWKRHLREDFDLHRSTLDKWQREQFAPIPVILALDAWCSKGLAGKAALAQELVALGQLMAQQCAQMERVTHHAMKIANGESA